MKTRDKKRRRRRIINNNNTRNSARTPKSKLDLAAVTAPPVIPQLFKWHGQATHS